MPRVFDMSAFETSAREFFTTLIREEADLVLDVRLRNTNQLCGFTKKKDLEYLIPTITGAAYVHDLQLAPSAELLGAYQNHDIDWETYKHWYLREMDQAKARDHFRESYGGYQSVCILGTATRKRRSHSEALVELLGNA
ncbi:MAG: DUF488 domain-containing protein [Eggerthellaceae bacterium]|jgi:uncharacterized protein YeaO (DUF488 family)